MRKLLKMLHEVGAVGVLGSFAACVVLLATAPTDSLVANAAVLHGVAAVTRWILVPSLALVAVSGLAAIAANSAYLDAGWAWAKALLGISMFEGTLLTVGGSARRAAELSALAAAGGANDPAQLADALRTAWRGLAVLVVLALVNIVLAVWKPRFGRRPAA